VSQKKSTFLFLYKGLLPATVLLKGLLDTFLALGLIYHNSEAWKKFHLHSSMMFVYTRITISQSMNSPKARIYQLSHKYSKF